MQSENRFFEDMAKMMNGAAGTLAGMARESEASFKERARAWIGGLDFVSRDEFDAVKAMAAAARDEVAALRAEIVTLKAPATGAPTSDTPGAGAGVAFPD